MSDNRNSYRSITKAIGLFGGVEVFKILISIIRNKIIAILLGPLGMGISGIISSSLSIISSITGFGLHTSGVRDVSLAFSTGDNKKIGKIVFVMKRLTLLTGLLGTIFTLVFARTLSIWSFGNDEYTTWFRLVSIFLLFEQITIGQRIIMQGTFNYRYLARTSLIASIFGFIITIPLYFIWGIDAIVPVIVISSFIGLLISWIYTKKIKIKQVKLTFKEVFLEGRTTLKLGISIASTGILYAGSTYISRLYIANQGSIEDVGLYSAGISIVTQYINIVLGAMGTDYQPRLSAASNNSQLFVEIINKQMKLLVTIIAPLIVIFIVFIKEIIEILYSDKFLDITGMIEWIMIGMFFRAVSWSISFGFVANGNAKQFFWNELAATIYTLTLTILGYRWAGFLGIGIAFCLGYIIYTAQVYLLGKKCFSYKFSPDFYKIIIPVILSSFLFIFILNYFGYSPLRYVIGFFWLMGICIFTYIMLNKMLNLNEFIIKFKNNIINK